MQISETKVSEGQRVELSVVLNSYLFQDFSHYMYMRQERSMAISYHNCEMRWSTRCNVKI